MTEKFRNKYRIPSARMQHWNYQWAGAYFITICTKDRIHFFGEIKNGEMKLNEIGEMVQNEWIISPELRPDMNLELGEFVVMPNHFHGILIIGENKYNRYDGGDDMDGDMGDGWDRGMNRGTDHGADHGADRRIRRDAMHCVSTNTNTNTNADTNTDTNTNMNTDTKTHTTNQFGPQRKNVSSIIRGFKSAVTKNARLINPDFGWQPRFHDHIIRDEKSFNNITHYILNNPLNWEKDKFYGKL